MRVFVMTRFVVLSVVLLSCAPLFPAQLRVSKAPVIGTYSSIQYHQESGDLVGIEVRIAPVQEEHYQGVIQFCGGLPSKLILVEIQAAKGALSFEIPSDSGYGGRFEGTYSSSGIKGTIKFASGQHETVRLPRKRSYWDR